MDVRYREITPADKKSISRLGAKVFGLLGQFFVSLESGGWIAEAGPGLDKIPEGTPIGAIILKKFTINNESVGLISWIMSHPEVRGSGIASKLRQLGDEWFENQNIHKSFALIEHYNQSSSKLFAGNGYRPLGIAEQLKLFGVKIFPVWLKSYFLVSIGLGLWYRDKSEPQREISPRGKTGFLKSLGFNSLLLFILMIRLTVPLGFFPLLASAVFVSLTLLVTRTVPFWAGTRIMGLPTHYIAWSGGSPLVLAVATITGGYIPFPGSLYPKQSSYNYKQNLPAIGLGSLCAALGLFGLLILIRLVDFDPNLPYWMFINYQILQSIVPILIIVDVLIPLFPFTGYLGRQIYSWKPWIWFVLSPLILGVVFFVH